MLDPDAGITKDGICKKIAYKMNKEITITRSVESIKSKVYDLIGRFKTAADEACNTGEGIRAFSGEECFREFMLGRFQYYYDLVDVLGSPHSINSVYNTDESKPDNFDSSVDSGNDCGNESNNEDNDDSNTNTTSDVTTSTTCDVSTNTPCNEVRTKTQRNKSVITTTKKTKKQKEGKATKDAMKGFHTNSAKGKLNTIIVGSGTETTDMNEMLTAKKDLYKAKLVLETISSNLASIKARAEAKKEDTPLTDEM